jgi:creatinine amidohydrolase
MMMHLRPDLVRTSEAARARSLGEDLGETLRRVAPEGSASFSWLAGDLNPDGVVGDATLADADLGAQLVSHYGVVLSEVIEDARAFPLKRLEPDTP